ncbi:MAG: hypothetical protein QNJ47_05585 [Nostocaceae cyanobacterium]|nr:hypothetical protein [Nostocaceae cyanobacterium]
MSKQFDFRWRYQPRNYMDVQLLEYIQKNYIMSKNDMLLLALRSFWLPSALAADYRISESKVQRVAWNAVQTLQKQAKEVLELVGLEDTSLMKIPTNTTVNSTMSSLDELRNQAGENIYDDTGLSNFF